jgi:hypothetical protein
MSKEVIMVSKVGNNEQFDTDILQCKVDILLARNIIPPYDNITQKNPVTQNSTAETTQSSHKDTNSIPIPIEEIPAKRTPPLPEPIIQAETSEETPKIPRFDLAEEIMAEQRKITAIRRKAPGQKTEAQRLKPETQIVDHIIEQPKPLLSEQEKIITEIVARDIERLCRGDYSSEQRI